MPLQQATDLLARYDVGEIRNENLFNILFRGYPKRHPRGRKQEEGIRQKWTTGT